MSNNIRTGIGSEDQAMRLAREARVGLAADLRDIQQVGGRLIRAGEKRLKSSALILGAVVLGGVTLGLILSAFGRSSGGKRAISAARGLVGKALVTAGTRVVTELISRGMNRAGEHSEVTH